MPIRLIGANRMHHSIKADVIYTTAIFLIFNLSLCTHYSGWMSCLISYVWDLLICEQREASAIFKMKIYAYTENRTSDQRGASNHSATLTVNDLLFNLLHYFDMPINTCGNACLELILVSCVLELTVRNKICISFTNVEVIYYCLQNCVWSNLTIINLISCLHCHYSEIV